MGLSAFRKLSWEQYKKIIADEKSRMVPFDPHFRGPFEWRDEMFWNRGYYVLYSERGNHVIFDYCTPQWIARMHSENDYSPCQIVSVAGSEYIMTGWTTHRGYKLGRPPFMTIKLTICRWK